MVWRNIFGRQSLPYKSSRWRAVLGLHLTRNNIVQGLTDRRCQTSYVPEGLGAKRRPLERTVHHWRFSLEALT